MATTKHIIKRKNLKFRFLDITDRVSFRNILCNFCNKCNTFVIIRHILKFVKMFVKKDEKSRETLYLSDFLLFLNQAENRWKIMKNHR